VRDGPRDRPAAVAKNLYFGLATVARSLLPSSTLFYDGNADP
jgi:hypothetical protein